MTSSTESGVARERIERERMERVQAATLSGTTYESVKEPIADGAQAEASADKKSIAMLSISHVVDDLNQGALPTLLPYLITAHHLSYQAAAGLVLTTNLVSSILQPFLGTLSDKPSWKINIAPIGLAMASIGVGLSGVMPNYACLLIGAAIGGIGLAAYHPDAARTTNFVSGEKKATGMGFFALGGNLGFAIGPLVATACVMAAGIRGSLLLLIPSFVMAAILYKHMKKLDATIAGKKRQAKTRGAGASEVDRWWPFTFLTLTIVCRSVIFFGFNTFLPLYWIHDLAQSKAAGGMALTVFLLAGAAGTLAGGRLADKVGQWPVLFTSFGLVPFAIAAFLAANNPWLALALLVPLGMTMSASLSVNVVMGQKYLPTRIGLAAGVTLGLAGSIGGLITPVIGKVADLWGLHDALLLLIAAGVIAFALIATTRIADKKTAVSP